MDDVDLKWRYQLINYGADENRRMDGTSLSNFWV